VAWREDKHARQSTLAALPVLAGAEQLHVFAGVRERQSQPVLPEALADRERAPELHVIALGGRPLGETLLARSQALGVDLLVMGAYYHSPLREQIFGGVTRYMLTHAGIPLLMFH
jgi:nucleotide-binding universal stress UspA family protein